MAEVVGGALLSASLQVLLDRLTPHADQFLMFIRGKKLDKNLLYGLKPPLIAARAVLNDAELKQIKDSALKDWLDDLKDAVYDADDLIDEISTKAATQNQVCDFSSHNLNVRDREMVDKLGAITDRLKLIVGQKKDLHLKSSVPENLSWRPQSTSLVKVSDVYGREKDKEAIIELLSDDNDTLSVIPFVGMAGIGKTTLVKLVYNDDVVKKKFDLLAWVCVSEAFDLLKITHTIIKAVSPGYHCDIMDLNLLQLDLKERLSGKKFFVVLDDVWNEKYEDWDSLMNPFHYGEEGSKILVTTRSERVGSMVKTIPSFYRLGFLSNEDCLAVFARHAFHSTDSTSNSYLEKIGRDVANKCKGLPLAAKALGGLFRSKPNIKYWNTILKNDIWDSTENEIIPALRVSYHYLPPHLKQCFVYCSLFPEDYEFNKKALILMWMAEGFLQPSKRRMTMEDIGSEYFDDLTSRSFFQPSSQKDRHFVMHDLIHEFATTIVGDFYFRSGNSEGKKVSSKTHHLSYNVPLYSSLDDFEFLGRTKALRTFLGFNFQHIPSSLGNAPYILLSSLKYLRVLSLIYFEALKTLPDSMGEFIHLRYLDLSSTRIESLPHSLCKLCNLQTLKLRDCYNLKMLPSDMQDLVNLRYLDIRDTSLKEMPRGMSKLKDLQSLTNFIVGKEQGTLIGELGELQNLQDGLIISKLENVKNGKEAYESRIEKKHIKYLELSWSSDGCINNSQTERDILDKLQPHCNIEMLIINGYRGTIFSNWLGSHSYHNMTWLLLRNCKNCCILPPLGQLSSLKTLEIIGFENVETISVEFFKGGDCSLVTPFASLKSLRFDHMSCWKEWRSIEMEAFPKLQRLEISNCPKLTRDLPCQLLSLETLEIQRCPLLASSIPRCSEIQKLTILGSEKVVLLELPLSLCSLTISGRQQVEYMIEAMTHSENCCLHYLELQNCSYALSLPVIHMPSSVKILIIRNCKYLEFPQQQCHVSLECLRIINSYDTLTSFSLEIFPNLKELEINGCENMNSILVSNAPLPNLQSIYIYGCKNLKSLSDHTRSVLPNLKKLVIFNFPEFGPFLDSCTKCHLPSLTYLDIRGSITVKCFPDEGLLPATLMTLVLSDFSRLETLDCKGLQYLTSLQELTISFSPKLQKMAGQMLPASLKKLEIYYCDLLEERCRMKDGEIWPKISHIPAIRLTYGLIS